MGGLRNDLEVLLLDTLAYQVKCDELADKAEFDTTRQAMLLHKRTAQAYERRISEMLSARRVEEAERDLLARGIVRP